MYCEKCGSLIIGTQRFCTSCGFQVTSNEGGTSSDALSSYSYNSTEKVSAGFKPFWGLITAPLSVATFYLAGILTVEYDGSSVGTMLLIVSLIFAACGLFLSANSAGRRFKNRGFAIIGIILNIVLPIVGVTYLLSNVFY